MWKRAMKMVLRADIGGKVGRGFKPVRHTCQLSGLALALAPPEGAALGWAEAQGALLPSGEAGESEPIGVTLRRLMVWAAAGTLEVGYYDAPLVPLAEAFVVAEEGEVEAPAETRPEAQEPPQVASEDSGGGTSTQAKLSPEEARLHAIYDALLERLTTLPTMDQIGLAKPTAEMVAGLGEMLERMAANPLAQARSR